MHRILTMARHDAQSRLQGENGSRVASLTPPSYYQQGTGDTDRILILYHGRCERRAMKSSRLCFVASIGPAALTTHAIGQDRYLICSKQGTNRDPIICNLPTMKSPQQPQPYLVLVGLIWCPSDLRYGIDVRASSDNVNGVPGQLPSGVEWGRPDCPHGCPSSLGNSETAKRK